jgi:hypothetical protein
VEIGEQFTEYLMTMFTGTFKDPVHGILIDTHNPGGGADAVTFGQTPHHALNHRLLQVETEKYCVATLGESGLTGFAPEQLGFMFSVTIIADDVTVSLLCIILTFLVGTEALSYIHGYPSDYVSLLEKLPYHNQRDRSIINYNELGTIYFFLVAMKYFFSILYGGV